MINGINHITWTVNDIEETFDFYVNLLGMKPVMKSAISAYFLCGTFWIAVVKAPTTMLTRYNHIAFTVEAEAYDICVEKLIKYGVVAWKENETEGNSFYFLDPSGNKMELHVGDLHSRIADGKARWGDDICWYI